jgi:cytoskeletal protein RodZ
MQEPNLNSQQKYLKNLTEIGSRLQQIRLEKRLSLEEISAQTLIQARLLRAIEQGQLEELPEPFYIKELIKKFANAMSLDGEALAKTLDLDSCGSKSTLKTQKHQKNRQSQSSWSLPSPPSFQFQFPFQLRPYHLYIFYIVLIVMAVRVLSNLVEPSTLSVQTAQQEQQAIPTLSSSVAVSPETSSQSLTVSQPDSTQSAKPVVVDVSVKDRCWVRIMVDGKKEFEGFLPEGTRKTWAADNHLTIRAGNAGGVFVTFKDKQAQQLGKPGQVEEVTYRAN